MKSRLYKPKQIFSGRIGTLDTWKGKVYLCHPNNRGGAAKSITIKTYPKQQFISPPIFSLLWFYPNAPQDFAFLITT